MKKLTASVSIFMLLLALSACSDNNATGPDPNPDPNPPPAEGDYKTLDITVTLPEGSAVDLSQTTVMSLSVESEVDANGQAKMAYNEGTTQLGYLFDADDNLLMAGFVNTDQPVINIETTTEVLFYIGFGTIMQPPEIKEKFIAEVRTIPGFDAFAGQIAQLFVTNPRMFQEGVYALPLQAKVEELQQTNTLDLPTNQLQVDGADIRSGLQLADVDFEHFTITNTYRRRAHAFIYKTAFKDENGKETLLKEEIGRSDKADKESKISPTGAIREFLGVFADWAAGKGADFAATTTDPILLPLKENESESTYKVRVVGAALISPKEFDGMTSAEADKYNQILIETFTIDFFLPLFLDLKGHKGLLKKANLSEQAVEDLVKIVEPALASTPAAYDKLKEGKFKEAISDYLNAFRVNAAGSGLKDLLVNVFEFFAKRAAPDQYIQKGNIIEKGLKKGAKVIEAFDYGLKAIDYGRLSIHILSSRAFEEWTVKAKSSDVILIPKEQVAIPFDPKELEVKTQTQLSDGEAFQYEWSTTGRYGTLSDERGHEGTAFTSSLKKVTYKSELQSDQLGDGENIEEIYVTVSIKQGSRIIKVNTDTARINVQPFKYEIQPEGITMKGGTTVKLNLIRVDGFNPFENTSAYDHKVVWTTSGRYGKLQGGHNTVTTYNTDNISYEALDKDVRDATENFTARIYFKPKDETKYQLLDEAKGSLKIDNDPKKKIFFRKFNIRTEIFDPSQCTGATITAALVSFAPVEDAESYAVTIFLNADSAPVNGSTRDIGPVTWQAGQPVPSNYRFLTPSGLYDGQLHVQVAAGTYCADAEYQAKVEAALANLKGYGQIVVTLKD